MTDFKPGTVAVATVRGVENSLVMRTSGTHVGADHWASAENIRGWRVHTKSDVTDVRPLVVIDPSGLYDDGCVGTPAEFARTLRLIANADGLTYRARIVNRAADQIEAQTKPPIDEPKGIGAVIEVDGGVRFVRIHDGFWVSEDESQTWANLNPVRVLSDGVAS